MTQPISLNYVRAAKCDYQAVPVEHDAKVIAAQLRGIQSQLALIKDYLRLQGYDTASLFAGSALINCQLAAKTLDLENGA